MSTTAGKPAGKRAFGNALSGNAMTAQKSYMSKPKLDALEGTTGNATWKDEATAKRATESVCDARARPEAKKRQPQAPVPQVTKPSVALKCAKEEKEEPQWKVDAREAGEREAARLAAKAEAAKAEKQTLAAERAVTKRTAQEAQKVRAEKMRTQMRKQREAMKNKPAAAPAVVIGADDLAVILTQRDQEEIDLEIELFEAEIALSREREAGAAKAEAERLRGEQEGERAQVELRAQVWTRARTLGPAPTPALNPALTPALTPSRRRRPRPLAAWRRRRVRRRRRRRRRRPSRRRPPSGF